MFFLAIAPMLVARFVFYITFHDEFAQLSPQEVISAFIVGLRFDVSIAATVVGLPLLCMLLPSKFCCGPRWQGLWMWTVYIAIVVMVFLIAVDMYYFAAVHRHAGPEVSALAADVSAVVYMVVSDFPIALTTFAVAAVLGAWGWRVLTAITPQAPATLWPRWCGIFVFLVVAVLAGRGGLQYKPLSVADSFFNNSYAAGYLALNGPFSLIHSLERDKPVVAEFMRSEEAVALTREWLRAPGDEFPDPNLPIYRYSVGNAHIQQPNIVILLLESWDASNVDAMRLAQGKPLRGITPNFDALAREGRLYTNFYAVGQRSIEGIAALVAGVPTTPGMPSMGEGLEQNRLSFLGELAKALGYRTIMLQSSNRGSFYVDAIASRAGFEIYEGAEDMPELHADKQQNAAWGTWDHNTLQEANRLFSEAKKPFLGFVFTSSTHTPFAVPTERWRKFSENSEKEKFFNTMYYSDWALGEFFAAAKKAGYYDNTIFVLTGDHVSHFVDDNEYLPNRYRVPLLLVGPGIEIGKDDRVGGHLDVIPTLIDAAGWRTHYAALGRSLLDNSRPEMRAVLAVRSPLVDWITADGWLGHDLRQRVGTSPNLTSLHADAMEKNLTAAFQIMSKALVENRISK